MMFQTASRTRNVGELWDVNEAGGAAVGKFRFATTATCDEGLSYFPWHYTV